PGNITMPPNAPAIYDSAGNLNYNGWGGANTDARSVYPFANLKQPYTSKTNFLNSNLSLSFEPIKGLSLSSSFGYNSAQADQENFLTISSQDPLYSPTGTAYDGVNSNKNWIIEPQITYNRIVGKGKFNILIGASFQQAKTESTNIGAYGYNSDLLIKNIASALAISSGNYTGEYKYAAMYARINYNI